MSAACLHNCLAEQLAYEATLPPPQGCLPVNIAESPESIILNSKMNSEPWPYTSRIGLPHAGVWTFDYVHKLKPPAGAVAMDEQEFLSFIGFNFDDDRDDDGYGHCDSRGDGGGGDGDNDSVGDAGNCSTLDHEDEDDRNAHDETKRISKQHNVHCPSPSDWELVAPLSTLELQNDLHDRARNLCSVHFLTLRQAMMLVTRLGNMFLQIDVIVSLWPRIIDWHGFDQVVQDNPI